MRARPFRSLAVLPVRLLAVLLLGPLPAAAHPLDLLAIQVTVERETVREVVRLNPQTLLLLAPLGVAAEALDDDVLARGLPLIEAGLWDDMLLRPAHPEGAPACPRGPSTARVVEGLVELRAAFTCPQGALRQDFRLLSVLPDGYHVALELAAGEGPPVQRFARREAPGILLPSTVHAPGTEGALAGEGARSFGGWVALGVRHILEGFDHLAFLAALLLLGGGLRRILVLVTGFTVAHSITLGATALGLVRLGPRAVTWVELAIAASIVVVAALNLRGGEGRHRVLVTFAFGLLHGFGFASVLAGYGLGSPAWASLLGFNLGVELGQAAVVLVAAPALAWLRARPRTGRWVVPVGSVLLLVLGLWWSVERLVPVTVFQPPPLG